MSKRILSCLVILAVVLGLAAPVFGEAAEFVLQNLEIDQTGHGEIYGYVEGGECGDAVSLLIFAGDGQSLTGEEIVYIDQKNLGNNGVILFEFCISSRWSENEVAVRLGGFNGEAFTQKLQVPKLPPGIESVVNNSVMYGMDVYTADSIYLTGEYVADSIAHGGNVIYFKLGDCWYDLLDNEATSSAYLVPENAEGKEAMNKLPLRWYYVRRSKGEFEQSEVLTDVHIR